MEGKEKSREAMREGEGKREEYGHLAFHALNLPPPPQLFLPIQLPHTAALFLGFLIHYLIGFLNSCE
ncbi:hypothetical protein C1H46_015992 [Malus baccata]|uniref:Uncharacterized protein n=1 Tax=Malus baccata TaxID=106549 RepID=A0A540MI09_MALBA|nr:hypothetical protein C1H46_015992 [Malus baccata]